VDVKAGASAGPGVNGGFQGTVKSPMNKGRGYKIPGCGLAGDWPGAWTQTYAQVDTEAGPHGFDENYFVAQVAGLSQIAGEFMQVRPLVIDLGWGELKTATSALKDPAALAQYVGVFRSVEAGRNDQARSGLKDLAAKHTMLSPRIDAQLAKLA
jgi:hypothetical protein